MFFSDFIVLCFFVTIGVSQNVEEAQTSDNICHMCDCDINNAVDCSSRQIASLFESHSWDAVRSLNITKIDLSHNQLSKVTVFPELPVQNLNLSNCAIEKFDRGAFMFLSNLTVLDLSNNKITSSSLHRWVFIGLQQTIEQLTLPAQVAVGVLKVKYLSLAYNEIHSLVQDLFRYMQDLEILDLSGNPLVYFDQVTMGAVTELVKLKELHLSSCELESLPEGLLRRQRRLQYLDLSDNRFTSVPTVVMEPANLQVLNFSKNPLEKLEADTAITKLTKLKELRLCRLSKLQSIAAGALGGLENLEVLSICDNPRLSTLDPSFLKWEDEMDVERWPLLKELYLNNNNLTEINAHLLDRWDQLINVDFTNNPFFCECGNQWMVDVLVPTIMATTANNSAGNMVCYKPPELRSLRFSTLYETSKKLPCSDTIDRQVPPGPDTAIMLGIMIGIFTTFPIVLIVVLLWKKGFFTRCREKWNDSKDEDDEETDGL